MKQRGKRRRFSTQKGLAGLLAFVLLSETAAVPLAEAKARDGFWSDRRAAASQAQSPSRPLLAALPAALGEAPVRPQALLDSPLGLTPLSRRPPAAVLSAPLRDVLARLSPAYATVVRVHDARSDAAPVLIVQDVHLNGEAQKNIAALLKSAATARAIDAVGVEAAFGPLDFTGLRDFPDTSAVDRVARRYLDHNRIAAASFAGMTLVSPPLFAGIDDPVGYRANVDAYRRSRSARSRAEQGLDEAERTLALEKAHAFSPAMSRFDASRSAYAAGRMSLDAFVQELLSLGGRPEPVVDRFRIAAALERRLDWPSIERERRQVIERLAARLSPKDLSDLLARSAAYRAGTIGYADFYGWVRELCRNHAVDLSKTPAFESYVRYLLLADAIDGPSLLEAVDRLRTTVLARVARTPAERRLAERSERIELARKLVGFELTPEEWERYRALSSASGAREAALAPFEAFYAAADRRTDVMADRLLALPSKRARVAILGGFHAPRLARKLEARGLACAIVSPRLTRVESDASAYLSVFAREKTPLERLFAGEKIFLADAETVAGAHGAALPVEREMRVAETLAMLADDPAARPGPAAGVALLPDANPADGAVPLEVDGQKLLAAEAGRFDARRYDAVPGPDADGVVALRPKQTAIERVAGALAVLAAIASDRRFLSVWLAWSFSASPPVALTATIVLWMPSLSGRRGSALRWSGVAALALLALALAGDWHAVSAAGLDDVGANAAGAGAAIGAARLVVGAAITGAARYFRRTASAPRIAAVPAAPVIAPGPAAGPEAPVAGPQAPVSETASRSTNVDVLDDVLSDFESLRPAPRAADVNRPEEIAWTSVVANPAAPKRTVSLTTVFRASPGASRTGDFRIVAPESTARGAAAVAGPRSDRRMAPAFESLEKRRVAAGRMEPLEFDGAVQPSTIGRDLDPGDAGHTYAVITFRDAENIAKGAEMSVIYGERESDGSMAPVRRTAWVPADATVVVPVLPGADAIAAQLTSVTDAGRVPTDFPNVGDVTFVDQAPAGHPVLDLRSWNVSLGFSTDRALTDPAFDHRGDFSTTYDDVQFDYAVPQDGHQYVVRLVSAGAGQDGLAVAGAQSDFLPADKPGGYAFHIEPGMRDGVIELFEVEPNGSVQRVDPKSVVPATKTLVTDAEARNVVTLSAQPLSPIKVNGALDPSALYAARPDGAAGIALVHIDPSQSPDAASIRLFADAGGQTRYTDPIPFGNVRYLAGLALDAADASAVGYVEYDAAGDPLAVPPGSGDFVTYVRATAEPLHPETMVQGVYADVDKDGTPETNVVFADTTGLDGDSTRVEGRFSRGVLIVTANNPSTGESRSRVVAVDANGPLSLSVQRPEGFTQIAVTSIASDGSALPVTLPVRFTVEQNAAALPLTGTRARPAKVDGADRPDILSISLSPDTKSVSLSAFGLPRGDGYSYRVSFTRNQIPFDADGAPLPGADRAATGAPVTGLSFNVPTGADGVGVQVFGANGERIDARAATVVFTESKAPAETPAALDSVPLGPALIGGVRRTDVLSAPIPAGAASVRLFATGLPTGPGLSYRISFTRNGVPFDANNNPLNGRDLKPTSDGAWNLDFDVPAGADGIGIEVFGAHGEAVATDKANAFIEPSRNAAENPADLASVPLGPALIGGVRRTDVLSAPIPAGATSVRLFATGLPQGEGLTYRISFTRNGLPFDAANNALPARALTPTKSGAWSLDFDVPAGADGIGLQVFGPDGAPVATDKANAFIEASRSAAEAPLAVDSYSAQPALIANTIRDDVRIVTVPAGVSGGFAVFHLRLADGTRYVLVANVGNEREVTGVLTADNSRFEEGVALALPAGANSVVLETFGGAASVADVDFTNQAAAAVPTEAVTRLQPAIIAGEQRNDVLGARLAPTTQGVLLTALGLPQIPGATYRIHFTRDGKDVAGEAVTDIKGDVTDLPLAVPNGANEVSIQVFGPHGERVDISGTTTFVRQYNMPPSNGAALNSHDLSPSQTGVSYFGTFGRAVEGLILSLANLPPGTELVQISFLLPSLFSGRLTFESALVNVHGATSLWRIPIDLPMGNGGVVEVNFLNGRGTFVAGFSAQGILDALSFAPQNALPFTPRSTGLTAGPGGDTVVFSMSAIYVGPGLQAFVTIYANGRTVSGIYSVPITTIVMPKLTAAAAPSAIGLLSSGSGSQTGRPRTVGQGRPAPKIFRAIYPPEMDSENDTPPETPAESSLFDQLVPRLEEALGGEADRTSDHSASIETEFGWIDIEKVPGGDVQIFVRPENSTERSVIETLDGQERLTADRVTRMVERIRSRFGVDAAAGAAVGEVRSAATHRRVLTASLRSDAAGDAGPAAKDAAAEKAPPVAAARSVSAAPAASPLTRLGTRLHDVLRALWRPVLGTIAAGLFILAVLRIRESKQEVDRGAVIRPARPGESLVPHRATEDEPVSAELFSVIRNDPRVAVVLRTDRRRRDEAFRLGARLRDVSEAERPRVQREATDFLRRLQWEEPALRNVYGWEDGAVVYRPMPASAPESGSPAAPALTADVFDQILADRPVANVLRRDKEFRREARALAAKLREIESPANVDAAVTFLRRLWHAHPAVRIAIGWDAKHELLYRPPETRPAATVMAPAEEGEAVRPSRRGLKTLIGAYIVAQVAAWFQPLPLPPPGGRNAPMGALRALLEEARRTSRADGRAPPPIVIRDPAGANGSIAPLPRPDVSAEIARIDRFARLGQEGRAPIRVTPAQRALAAELAAQNDRNVSALGAPYVMTGGDKDFDKLSTPYELKQRGQELLASARAAQAKAVLHQQVPVWPTEFGGMSSFLDTRTGAAWYAEHAERLGQMLHLAGTIADVWAQDGGRDDELFFLYKDLLNYCLDFAMPDGGMPLSPGSRATTGEYQLAMFRGSLPMYLMTRGTPENERYRYAVAQSLTYLLKAHYKNGSFVAKSPDSGREAVTPDVAGWALSIVGPQLLDALGFDVRGLVRQCSVIPDFVYVEWVGRNQAFGLSSSLPWLRARADALRQDADRAAAENRAADAARLRGESTTVSAEADAAEAGLQRIVDFVFGLPRQPADQGSGLAMAYRYTGQGDRANPKNYAPTQESTGWGWSTRKNGTAAVSNDTLVFLAANWDPERGPTIDWASMKAHVPVDPPDRPLRFERGRRVEPYSLRDARETFRRNNEYLTAVEDLLYTMDAQGRPVYAAVLFDAKNGTYKGALRKPHNAEESLRFPMVVFETRPNAQVFNRYAQGARWDADGVWVAPRNSAAWGMGVRMLNRKTGAVWMINASAAVSVIYDSRLFDQRTGALGDRVLFHPENNVPERELAYLITAGYLDIAVRVFGGEEKGDVVPGQMDLGRFRIRPQNINDSELTETDRARLNRLARFLERRLVQPNFRDPQRWVRALRSALQAGDKGVRTEDNPALWTIKQRMADIQRDETLTVADRMERIRALYAQYNRARSAIFHAADVEAGYPEPGLNDYERDFYALRDRRELTWALYSLETDPRRKEAYLEEWKQLRNNAIGNLAQHVGFGQARRQLAAEERSARALQTGEAFVPAQDVLGREMPFLKPSQVALSEGQLPLFPEDVWDSSGLLWMRVQPTRGDPYIRILNQRGDDVWMIHGHDIRINGEPLEFLTGTIPLDARIEGGITVSRVNRLWAKGDRIGEDSIAAGHRAGTVNSFIAGIQSDLDRGALRVSQRGVERLDQRGRVDTRTDDRHQTEIHTVPTWDRPDVLLTDREFPAGWSAHYSRIVMNRQAARYLPANIEIRKSGATRERWTLIVDEHNRPVTDGAGRVRYVVENVVEVPASRRVRDIFRNPFAAPATEFKTLRSRVVTYTAEGVLYASDDLEKHERTYYDADEQRAYLNGERIRGPHGEPVAVDLELPLRSVKLTGGVEGAETARFETTVDVENGAFKGIVVKRVDLERPGVVETSRFERAPFDYVNENEGPSNVRLRHKTTEETIAGQVATRIEEDVYYEDDANIAPEVRAKAAAVNRRASRSGTSEFGRVSYHVAADGRRRLLQLGVSLGERPDLVRLTDETARLAGASASVRVDYGYDVRDRRYVRSETTEFLNGETVVGRLNRETGLLSLKRNADDEDASVEQPNREHAGWDEWEFKDGRVTTLSFYSVDDEVSNVLAAVPAGLEEATMAHHIYRPNPATGRYAWSETGLLNRWGHTIATIEPDPLYFDAGHQVINIVRAGSRDNQFLNRPERRDVHLYDPWTRAVGTEVVGVSHQRDPSTVIDFTGQPALAARLDRPGVSFVEITQSAERGGRTFSAFFEPRHAGEAIARVEGTGNSRMLHVPRFGSDLKPVGEDVYELVPQPGQAAQRVRFRSSHTELIADPAESERMEQAARQKGHRVLADAIAEARAAGRLRLFRIESLGYPADPSRPDDQRPIKTTLSLFNNYQQLASVDVDQNRLSFRFHDTDKPWVERGGVDYDFTGGKAGEALGLSLVLEPEAQNGEKPVFVLDIGLVTPFIEYRAADGVFRKIDNGDYTYPVDPDGRTQLLTANIFRARQEAVLEKMRARDFDGAIRAVRDPMTFEDPATGRRYEGGGFERRARLDFEYRPVEGEIERPDGTVESVVFSEAYLRERSVSARTRSYLYVGGQLSADPSNTSTVIVVKQKPGAGMFSESFRVGHGTVNGEPVRLVRKERTDQNGIKHTIIHGEIDPAVAMPEDPSRAWVDAHFHPRLIFRAIIDPNYPNSLARYRVANKTITTRVERINGVDVEFLHARANSTMKLPWGSVQYKVLTVLSTKPIDFGTATDDFDRFKFLKDNSNQLPYDAAIDSVGQQKSKRGFLEAIWSDFPRGSINEQGYPRDLNLARQFDVLSYEIEPGQETHLERLFQFDEGLATGGATYAYKPGHNEPGAYGPEEVIARLDHLIVGDGNTLGYQWNDRRRGGAAEMRLFYPWGTPFADVYKGKPGEPDHIWLIYSEAGIPSHAVGVTGNQIELWRTFDVNTWTDPNTNETYLIIREKDPGRAKAWNLLYDNPTGWIVSTQGGIFLAQKDETERLTSKYRGAPRFTDNIYNSALVGPYLRAPAVAEAEQVIAQAEAAKPFVDTAKPDDIKNIPVTPWPRFLRFLNETLSVAAALSAMTAVAVGLWRFLGRWSRSARGGFVGFLQTLGRAIVNRPAPINLNMADKEQLGDVFPPDVVSRVLAVRNERGFFHSVDDLAANGADGQPIVPAPLLARVARRLTVSEPAAAGPDLLAEAQTAAAGTGGESLLAHPLFAPIAGHARNLVRLGLLSDARVEEILRNVIAGLPARAASPDRIRGRALRDLYRTAYWDDGNNLSRENARMRPGVRARLTAEVTAIFERYGFPASNFENRRAIEQAVTQFATEIPMDVVELGEAAVPGEDEDPAFMVLDHRNGWRPISLEDRIIANNIIPRFVPFFVTNRPLMDYYGAQIRDRLRSGQTPAQVAEFMRRHEVFWYQVLRDQMEIKLESNRDPRMNGVAYRDERERLWRFLVRWEEMNDAFRYLQNRSDMDPSGRLPDWLLPGFVGPRNGTQARLAADFALNQGRFERLLQNVSDGVYLADDAARIRSNLSADAIQTLVEENIEGLVNTVRRVYRIPIITGEDDEPTVFTHVARLVTDPRFFNSLGPSSVIKAMLILTMGGIAVSLGHGWIFAAAVVVGAAVAFQASRRLTERVDFNRLRQGLFWTALTLALVSFVLVPYGAIEAVGLARLALNIGAYGALAAAVLATNVNGLRPYLGRQSVRITRAQFFWSLVTLISLGFATFITIFITYMVIFMPIPYTLAATGVLPAWTRVGFILLSLAPLGDMFFLTYFGITNLAKGIVRVYVGRKYEFALARAYDRPRRGLRWAPAVVSVAAFAFVGANGFPTLAVVTGLSALYLAYAGLAGMPSRRRTTLQLAREVFQKDPGQLEVLDMFVQDWRKDTWLSAPEEQRLTAAIAAARAADPANRNAAIDGVVAAMRSVSLPETREFITDWVNEFYRRDMPAAPRNYAELRPVSYQLSAFVEPPYITYEDINKPAGKQTQMGMLATSYRGQWALLCDDLEAKGLDPDKVRTLRALPQNEGQSLTSLLSRSNPQELAAIEAIEHWFNMRSQTYYANFQGAAKLKKVYRFYIRRFFPEATDEEVERMVDEKVQLVLFHPIVGAGIQGSLRKIYKGQTTADGKSLTDLSLNEYMNLLSEGAITLPDTKELTLAQRKYIEFITSERALVLLGAEPGKSNVHTGKYTTWMGAFSNVRGEIVIACDFDMRHHIQETWNVPNVGREFDQDPTLGVAVYNGDIFTRPLSPLANVMGLMEEGWLRGEQPTKREVGALEAYGKFVYRRSAVMNFEGLPDHYVAEDAKTAERAMTFGSTTGHLTYYKLGKGLSNQLGGALNPLRKWSGDAPESVYAPMFAKFVWSPFVHWTVKVDALMSYGFYLKKPSVRRVTAMVLVIFYFLNLNPWFGLPFALWVNSVIISQAIGYGGLMVYVEKSGWIRGTLAYLRVLIWPTFSFATAVTPQYADAVERGAAQQTAFLRTGGKGGPLGRYSDEDLYIFNQVSVMPGLILAILVLAFSSFDPIKFTTWNSQIATVIFGWWLGPFFFNPTFDSPTWFQRNVPRPVRAVAVIGALVLAYMGGPIVAVALGLFVAIVHWPPVPKNETAGGRVYRIARHAVLTAGAVFAGWIGGPVGVVVAALAIRTAKQPDAAANVRFMFLYSPTAVSLDLLNNLFPMAARLFGVPASLAVRAQRTVPIGLRLTMVVAALSFAYIHDANVLASFVSTVVLAVVIVERMGWERNLRGVIPSFTRMPFLRVNGEWMSLDEYLLRRAVRARRLYTLTHGRPGGPGETLGQFAGHSRYDHHIVPGLTRGVPGDYQGLYNSLGAYIDGPALGNPSVVLLWKVYRTTREVEKIAAGTLPTGAAREQIAALAAGPVKPWSEVLPKTPATAALAGRVRSAFQTVGPTWDSTMESVRGDWGKLSADQKSAAIHALDPRLPADVFEGLSGGDRDKRAALLEPEFIALQTVEAVVRPALGADWDAVVAAAGGDTGAAREWIFETVQSYAATYLPAYAALEIAYGPQPGQLANWKLPTTPEGHDSRFPLYNARLESLMNAVPAAWGERVERLRGEWAQASDAERNTWAAAAHLPTLSAAPTADERAALGRRWIAADTAQRFLEPAARPTDWENVLAINGGDSIAAGEWLFDKVDRYARGLARNVAEEWRYIEAPRLLPEVRPLVRAAREAEEAGAPNAADLRDAAANALWNRPELELIHGPLTTAFRGEEAARDAVFSWMKLADERQHALGVAAAGRGRVSHDEINAPIAAAFAADRVVEADAAGRIERVGAQAGEAASARRIAARVVDLVTGDQEGPLPDQGRLVFVAAESGARGNFLLYNGPDSFVIAHGGTRGGSRPTAFLPLDLMAALVDAADGSDRDRAADARRALRLLVRHEFHHAIEKLQANPGWEDGLEVEEIIGLLARLGLLTDGGPALPDDRSEEALETTARLAARAIAARSTDNAQAAARSVNDLLSSGEARRTLGLATYNPSAPAALRDAALRRALTGPSANRIPYLRRLAADLFARMGRGATPAAFRRALARALVSDDSGTFDDLISPAGAPTGRFATALVTPALAADLGRGGVAALLGSIASAARRRNAPAVVFASPDLAVGLRRLAQERNVSITVLPMPRGWVAGGTLNAAELERRLPARALAGATSAEVVVAAGTRVDLTGAGPLFAAAQAFVLARFLNGALRAVALTGRDLNDVAASFHYLGRFA